MTETKIPTPERPAADSRQYVTFWLNEEVYAIDALAVQEIIELGAVTKVPHLPDFFKGVINLRGTIIPIVDLKCKFGMASGDYRKHTCVVVTEIEGRVMGLIVDTVSDVLQIAGESLAAAPSFGTQVNTDFIKGMARVEGALVIILDLAEILSESDAAAVAGLEDGASPEPPRTPPTDEADR